MRGGHLIDMSLLLAYFWLCVVFVAPVVLTTVACIPLLSFMNKAHLLVAATIYL